MVKNPPANAGDMGSIPGSGRFLEERWKPTSVFLPETTPRPEEPGELTKSLTGLSN